MKDRSDDQSHHERTLLLRSYISLLKASETGIGLFHKDITGLHLKFQYLERMKVLFNVTFHTL